MNIDYYIKRRDMYTFNVPEGAGAKHDGLDGLLSFSYYVSQKGRLGSVRK